MATLFISGCFQSTTWVLPPPALVHHLTVVQYAYSIISIVSGIVALFVTVGITLVTGFISLARLDIQKIPMPLISKFMEPSLVAFNAALMVDHDNTNPIKFMALEWFCHRLKELRKVEVRLQALSPLCLCVHPQPRCVVVSPRVFAFIRVTLQRFGQIIIK
jgi:hypothetical protein